MPFREIIREIRHLQLRMFDEEFETELDLLRNLTNDNLILPPTPEQFLLAWCRLASHIFTAEGNTLDRCEMTLRNDPRNNLSNVDFQVSERLEDDCELIADLWARMIAAFNMYAEVKSEVMGANYQKIDFITPIIPDHPNENQWELLSSGRCVLYLSNTTILGLYSFLKRDMSELFWTSIIRVYNMNPQDSLPERSRPTTMHSNSVDNPTHNVAREYLECNEEIVENTLTNAKIAEMITKIKELPDKTKQAIYDMCICQQMDSSNSGELCDDDFLVLDFEDNLDDSDLDSDEIPY